MMDEASWKTRWISFKVPEGQNIFAQSRQEILVHDVRYSDADYFRDALCTHKGCPRELWFCKACYKGCIVEAAPDAVPSMQSLTVTKCAPRGSCWALLPPLDQGHIPTS